MERTKHAIAVDEQLAAMPLGERTEGGLVAGSNGRRKGVDFAGPRHRLAIVHVPSRAWRRRS